MRTRVSLKAMVGVSLLLGGLALACSSSDSGSPSTPTPVLAKTSTTSGDAQTATVAQALALPLRVIVTLSGAPQVGTTVTWATTSGTVTPGGPTDAAGIATATWTLGQTSGAVTATATVTGATGSPVTFTATAEPDVAAEISKAGGDGQTGSVNSALPPLQALVADQFGNGVPGVTVTWTKTSGDGAVAPGTSDTDADGIAEAVVTLGATAGDVTVHAAVAGLTGSPQTFTEHAVAPPPPPLALTVTVANNSFTPKVGTIGVGGTVTWTWAAGAVFHNVHSDGPPSFTSLAPLESAPFTYGPIQFNTAGTYKYHCENHGTAAGGGMAGSIVVQ